MENLVKTYFEIIINNEGTLKVIDIIKFNDENKIIEVSAYKQ